MGKLHTDLMYDWLRIAPCGCLDGGGLRGELCDGGAREEQYRNEGAEVVHLDLDFRVLLLQTLSLTDSLIGLSLSLTFNLLLCCVVCPS